MTKNERVIKANRKKVRMALTNERVAEALKIAGGHVSDTAKLCNRTQGRISQMISKSPELQKVRSEEIEELYQLAKDGLRYRVKKRDVASCIYVTKCLGKHEGFVERQEVIQANLNPGPTGVLLLPQPSEDLNSWEELASQWENERQVEYTDAEYEEDNDDY